MDNSLTLVELLQSRAEQHPDRVAFRHLIDGGAEAEEITYGQLDERARAVGAWLQHEGASGERALLVYPSGLDFLIGFFACQYAGAVAVPAYPPPSRRVLARLDAIVTDADARFALSTRATLERVHASVENIAGGQKLRWLATDQVPLTERPDWQKPTLNADDLAVLQYTSGSTTVPKGVMLTHRNLHHNLEVIRRTLGSTGEQDVGVCWLPLHHDMGLIGGVLEPIYVAGIGVLLPPASFVQRPLRWLEAISRYRASIVTAPNSAYDLCVDKSLPEERVGLDLSSLRVAFCGAETIRAETLDRFAETFAPHGFRREAFYPCYGLAEAALMVSCRSPSRPLTIQPVSVSALRTNKVLDSQPGEQTASFVGCGGPAEHHKIIIVDPETLNPCPPDRVGEIWAAGPSIAQGYWRKPSQTAETFQAHVAGTGEGPFLRTGDLGFLRNGDLFVAGRCKDLIIIRGRNYYPEDLEYTVQSSHAVLLRSRGAVFSIDRAGSERLVVVQEVDRRHHRTLNVDEVIRAIRSEITATYELEVDTVVLAKPLTIPTTSSGKIQRSSCRDAFLHNRLASLGHWQAPEPRSPDLLPTEVSAPDGASAIRAASSTRSEIEAWLISHLATALQVSSDEIDVSLPFAYYGLDSVRAVQLAGKLEAWLGRRFPPTLAYEYPTVERLARHLAGEPDGEPAGQISAERQVTDAIAIVGIGCRFPDAPGPATFWRLLRDGKDAISEVPPSRWDAHSFYDPDPARPGKMNTVWGGFLQEIDRFDPHFFGISPREAARMDPQQRLLLEVVWEAFEDSGLVPEQFAGTQTGVFVGISTNEYGQPQISEPALIDPYAGTGNALSMAANRLSYQFDFRGPSMAVDTACSSSLVAVHLACRSLRQGDCTLAVAAGVNVILSPAVTVYFTKAGFMAPDGRCKAFDSRANGYVRGEGAGAVILKPLSRALADRDPIYAVIRGSAVNNDGRTNGLTAPSREAQERVLAEAYREAGVAPGRVQYVEAHGTGTALGDPIEAQALGNVLAVDRPQSRHCAVGSVKTNIGHLEAAAGMAGLIKVALSLAHGEIPPSLHFKNPNPHIPFGELPLRVQDTLTKWPAVDQARLAGVSSFGFGGTNAHVVLEAAPPPASRLDREVAKDASSRLMPLSAKSAEALRALAGAYLDFLSPTGAGANISLQNLCYTAGERRSHFSHRLALRVRSHEDVIAGLRSFLRGERRAGLATGGKAPAQRAPLVFVFSGQGSQWWAMGRELMEQESVYREKLLQCDELLRPLAGWSLWEELTADEAHSRLRETAIAQPALFALQIALDALWRTWGIEPAAVVGHSVGEIAAAHVAGILDLPDALFLAFHRGQLMQRATGLGRMVAVRLSPAEAKLALAGYEGILSVAAHNGPHSCVLSGEPEALAQCVERLRHGNIAHRWLSGDYAFHSPQMNAYAEELVRASANLQPKLAKVPIASTLTGKIGDGADFNADYWGKQIHQPVRFAEAIQSLAHAGYTSFVEIGPHPILTSAISECLDTAKRNGLVLWSLRQGEEARTTLLDSLGVLYANGFEIEWSKLSAPDSQCARLPAYQWQRERCWCLPDDVWKPDRVRNGAGESHPLLGRHLPLAQPAGGHLWELELDRRVLPYLDDHRIDGVALVPMAVYVEMALAAGAEALGSTACVLTETTLERPLAVSDQATRMVQSILLPVSDREAVFHVYSHAANRDRHAGSWTRHATARVQRMGDA